MKLRLPKTLTAALIAAFTVTGTYATTTTKTTTYEDGTVFNGDIWTWNNADGQNVSSGSSKYTNYTTGQTYAGNSNMTSVGGADAFWKMIQFTSENAYVGNTLRFAGATGNVRLNTDYAKYVWVGGIITEAGNSGTYTLGRDSDTSFYLKGNQPVNMIINSNFTFWATNAEKSAVEIGTGGTWTVADGKVLEFNLPSVVHHANQTVNINGTGTVKFTKSYTGQAGAIFNVGEGATLTFAQAAQLGGTITNNGTVNFNGAVSLTSSLDGFESVAKGHYVDSRGGESQNGFYVGSTEYTIVKGSSYTGLTTVSHGGSQHTVTDGKITIGSASGTDWTTYHLNVENASVDLSEAITYAQTEGGTTLEEVIAKKSGAVVVVDSALSLNTLTVSAGADATINGGGSLAVSGGIEIVNGGSLTVDQGTTLKVSDAAAAKALMMSDAVTNNGTFELACEMQLDAGTSTVMGGALKVASGATLKLSNSKGTPTSIASFTSVELAGGNLWANTTMRTINALSVTGDSQIAFEDFPDAYASNPTKFTGTTRIDSGKTLTIYTNYKSSIQIAGLAGAGTLKLTTANRSDNGENVTIDSLEGFSGNISLAPGNANNPVRVTASLGNADVSMGTLSLNGNSAAATDTKHTFYKLTGEHNLTMAGIDGTKGEVSLTVPTLTLNTDSNHSYTGSLSISGQLVKTGAGSQTLGGFAINKTILVQGGTLTLNGTYSLDGLADDEGRTYTFEDETGAAADKTVGGFRITNGTKTVYTANGGAVSRADGTKFQLDGKDVEVDANGVYKFPTSADKTTLWVNGSTPLSYDTYYAASGEETKALTTAQVAGGATLAIGTNAVGTLAFQENGTTINLSGSGTVNAISGTGTLNLNGTVTLGSALTVGNGETFATSGTGSLNVGTLNANGGTTTFDSAASISRLIVNGSAAATVGGSGAVAVNSTTQDQGVEIGVGKTLTLLSENMNVAGTIHNNGNLIVGDGTNPALVKAVYFVNGNNNGGSSSFDIKANATLVATGADTDNSHASGWVMSEWNNSTTGKVAGTLLARNASIWGCDSVYTLNIENGGLVATKGVRAKKDNQAYTVNLKEGGTLVLGGTSTPGATVLNATAGSTIGTYATSGVDYSGTIATTAVDGKAVTFDTSLYTFNEAGTAITKGDTAGELTISGAITGTAAVAKAGAGTLVLTGANTYSGGTTVNAGTLKAASADALGAGDVTVNCGTLELTTTTAVAGDLTVNNGGTLVFAGANMLTADNLALGSGSVTFDLSKINVSHAGTITLATADTSASLGSASVQVVWEGLAPIFSHNGVQVSDNSWIITLTSAGQDLYWNGGTANWDASAASWHTEAAPEEPIAFTNGDTAIFAADTTQAVANISGAIEAAGVIVREDADVVLQAAQEAETATLDAPEIEISGALVSSVNMTATNIVGRGEAATWEIAAGSTVSTATLSADEGATLTISGGGSLHAETVTGEGTIVFTGDIQPVYTKIVVVEGKELELKGSVTRTISKDNLAIDGKLIIGGDYSLTIDGAYNPGTAGTDLHIRNNGNLAVSLGNDQNVLRMDEQSEGNLEIKSGHISYLSELGKQTLVMDNGTQLWFGNNAGAQDNPDFTNDIVLNGDVTLRVYGNSAHGSVTISGDVDGAGHTLTKTDGNQVLTFTGKVTLGGLNVEGSGEKLVFKGSGSNLGAIKATSGAFTIQFSKADGDETASYTFDTFAMSPDDHAATRWLIVDAGVTVNGTGDTLSEHATIMNSWGISGGGLEVNGTLNTVGVIGMDSGTNTSYLKGTGTINTKGLDLCNNNTSYIQGGITINITSDTGIYRRNTGNPSAIHLLDATLQAKDADWEFKTGGNNYTVTLDSASGTTFDAAANHTITLSKEMGGSGKLVKAGEGTVLVKGANSYSGGTAINKGTLETKNASALGTGNVSVGGNGTLLVSENLTIKGDNTAANNGLDNQGIVSIADGKTLTLWGLAAAKHYNLGTVNAAGDSAIIENTNHCATISLAAITGDASSVVLYSNHSSEPANWNLGTADAGTYSADELVLRVGDSTATSGDRTVYYNFNNAEMFSGTTVTIENAAISTPGKTMTNNVVLNADEVHVGGINDRAADTVVDKRNWSVTKGGDVEGRATLVLDGNDTEAAYSTAIKVGANVDIRKTGEGVQTFSGNMDDFEGTVAVEKGTINVLNVDELSVQDVVIGAGATLGVYNDATATASTGTEGSIAITQGHAISALEGATLNANLIMEAGSKLDVSYAQNSYGLIMGSRVTLKEGVLLQDSMHQEYPDINDFLFEYLSNNDYYSLYDSVEELYIQQGGTAQQVYELKFTDWRHFDLDASRIFTNLNENTYALVYNWNAENTGRVALVMIPEPTTGTLSLLALCALAARRRRK